VKIESVGLLTDSATAPRETISMLTAAAQACLRESRYSRDDIDLMINAGVYRNDFLCEPAVASIVAGRLQKDDGCNMPTDRGTLAFDLTNGALGVLQACYVAGTMIASGKFRKAMVMAAEVEINKEVCPSRRLGLEETGSALILDGSSRHGPGFGAFLFRSFTCRRHLFASHSAVAGGRTVLAFERDAMFEASCLDCIRDSVEELMALEGLRRSDVAAVLPPLISVGFVSRLGETLRVPQERMIHPPRDAADMHTSSLAFAVKRLRETKRVRAGEIGLIIGIAPGIQVGCATYRF
jgi:3-oxoacyl-[acyl-carrier-protein] synthase III